MSEARRAVVLVHGAGGGGWEWDAWARVFAAGDWRVFAPDLQPSPWFRFNVAFTEEPQVLAFLKAQSKD